MNNRDFDLDYRVLTITENGESSRIELTDIQATLFGFLLEKRGRIVSRAEIYRAYSGKDCYQSDLRVVAGHVNHLREKLGDAVFIKTVRGRGYVLIIPDCDLPSSGPTDPGKLYIYPDLRRVFVGDGELSLTTVQYQILHHLVQNPYTVCSNADIHKAYSGEESASEGNEKTVRNHVDNLREKLVGAAGYIETVRGIGYRFNPSKKPDS